MNDDRLDRLERMIETLVTTTAGIHNDLLKLARENAAEHAEYRQDIARLYQAFSEHYRNGHGDDQ